VGYNEAVEGVVDVSEAAIRHYGKSRGKIEATDLLSPDVGRGRDHRRGGGIEKRA